MRIALKKKHANLVIVSVLGGVREIRTPEPLLPVTRFPGVPLQPLEHHSFTGFSAKVVIFSGFAVIAYEFFSF